MTKEEFQREVVPMGEKMYRLAYRILGDSDSAKDALQDLFLKLWEKRGELRKLTNIEAFACTILKNRCLDKLRLQKPTVDTEVLKNEWHDPETIFENEEGADQVRRIMRRLPAKLRKIMEMRDIDCCTFEEIGELLNMTVNNVRVQLSHARKQVKDELKKIYSYGIQGN